MNALRPTLALLLLLCASTACESTARDGRAPVRSTPDGGTLAPDDDAEKPRAFSLDKECGRTLCDAFIYDCNAQLKRDYDECMRNCLQVGSCDICVNSFKVESSACRESECSEHEKATCQRFDFVAHGAAPDPELLEACDDYIDAFNVCSEEDVVIDCAEYASVERVELVESYRCFVTLTCEQHATATGCDFPADDVALADSVCSAAEACNTPCSESEHGSIAASGGWVRDDVRAALLGCASMHCEDVSRCIEGWLRAVDGAPNGS